jgi:hypothetical protein
VEGELAVDFTRLAYEVVRVEGDQTAADLDYVTYYHAALLWGLTFSAISSIRLGFSMGLGVGGPVEREYVHLVGADDYYGILQGYFRFGLSRAIWPELFLGLRAGESRFAFVTNFDGDPTHVEEMRIVPFIGLRVRFGP